MRQGQSLEQLRDVLLLHIDIQATAVPTTTGALLAPSNFKAKGKVLSEGASGGAGKGASKCGGKRRKVN